LVEIGMTGRRAEDGEGPEQISSEKQDPFRKERREKRALEEKSA